MKMSDAVEGYVLSSLAEGYSPLTIAAYRSALNIMIEYLGDKELTEISTQDLRRFMHYLVTDYSPTRVNNPSNTDPLSTASHHRYWKAMRSFFKWADRDLGCGRPDEKIKMPKSENKTVVPLTADEINKIINACDYANVPEGKRRSYKFRRPTALRDKALVLTLLDTGVRVGELTRIRIADVNLENGEVFIRPHHVKKTHSRTVFISAPTQKAIWRYLTSRDDSRGGDPLFVTVSNQPMTRMRVLGVVRSLGESAGVKNVHPHKFRHTFAITWLRNGGDPFTLKRLLGHSSLEIVNRYLDIANSDAENAHRRASPVESMLRRR